MQTKIFFSFKRDKLVLQHCKQCHNVFSSKINVFFNMVVAIFVLARA
jgi:hypothetical protein